MPTTGYPDILQYLQSVRVRLCLSQQFRGIHTKFRWDWSMAGMRQAAFDFARTR